jgi:hypothetical protein
MKKAEDVDEEEREKSGVPGSPRNFLSFPTHERVFGILERAE